MIRRWLCTVLVTVPLLLHVSGCSGNSPVAPSPRPSIPSSGPTGPTVPTEPTAQSWTVSGTVWLYGQTGVAAARSGTVFEWIEEGLGGSNFGSDISATGRYEIQVPK